MGIHGARIAAQAYGGMTYGPLGRPTVIEEADKEYWVVEVECVDHIRNLTVTQWQYQTLIVPARGGFKEIEHGGAIVQAKGFRNVILAVIPPQLRRLWINDYLDGREGFDPEKVLALPGGRAGMIEAGKRKPALSAPAKKKQQRL